MPLEPSQILGVVSPGQLFELLGGQVLLISSLLMIECPEQSVLFEALKQCRVFKRPDALCAKHRLAIGIQMHIWVLRLVFPVSSNV